MDLLAEAVSLRARGERFAFVTVVGCGGGHPVLLAPALCEEVLRMDPRRDRLDVVLRRLEAVGACERIEVGTAEVLANLNDPGAYARARRTVRRRRAR